MMESSRILVCDFTGLPIDEEELRALFDAAVLYLRERHQGVMRFKHVDAEGTIEAHGTVSNGPLHGDLFTTDYVWDGHERSIEFVLPPLARRMRVPGNAVTFFRVRSSAPTKKVRSRGKPARYLH